MCTDPTYNSRFNAMGSITISSRATRRRSAVRVSILILILIFIFSLARIIDRGILFDYHTLTLDAQEFPRWSHKSIVVHWRLRDIVRWRMLPIRAFLRPVLPNCPCTWSTPWYAVIARIRMVFIGMALVIVLEMFVSHVADYAARRLPTAIQVSHRKRWFHAASCFFVTAEPGGRSGFLGLTQNPLPLSSWPSSWKVLLVGSGMF